MKHESMKVNSTFLSCDGVQIGCISKGRNAGSPAESPSYLSVRELLLLIKSNNTQCYPDQVSTGTRFAAYPVIEEALYT